MIPRDELVVVHDRNGIRTLSYYFPIAVILSILVLSGSVLMAQDKNTYCPVTTSELAEEQFFTDYEGRRVFFCCNNCKKDFLSNPETYLVNLIGTAGTSQSGSSPQGDDGHTHKHTDGKSPEHNPAEHTINSDVGSVETSASGAHDHATDHGERSSAVSILGKFHPMVTHFPIALVISALLFSGLAVIVKIQTFDVVSVYSVQLAAFSGLVTVALGLAAGYSASYPSFLASYLSTHRLLGIVTGVMTFVTAWFGQRQLRTKSTRHAWIYRSLLLVNSGLVGITGHYGAALVFGPDHFDF